MRGRAWRQPAGALMVVALCVGGCRESVNPERGSPESPSPTATAQRGIALDRYNGTIGSGTPFEGGTHIGNGFNPTNPHVGDAIVATFFWRGSTNVITSVTDHLADGTPVGNRYTLVEYVTAGGMSMATYVAPDVRGFPDPNPDDDGVLDVHAITSSPVTGDGIILSAYRGVAGVAVGAHRSGTGSGAGPTLAGPGAIPLDAGALAYGVTLAAEPAGIDAPAGFSNVTNLSSPSIEADAEYAVTAGADTVDPAWTWYFNAESAPRAWLASVLALTPFAPAATRLRFTVQPRTTLPLMTIRPPVQVTAVDDGGAPVPTFTGAVTIAIGHNGGRLIPGNLSGTKTVAAASGVATFADLSISQLGNAYTLAAGAEGLAGAESAAFNVGAF